ncbi:tagaturonate reductase [Rhizobium sp. PP-F2F-G38]|uniref:Mannitol dehydrogenase family protein n=1 Tax=Ferranicluibacter rubi TaxID=2715133 RepID=A0AA44CA73_9HYPH|nr:mannitol dehydrogenase family protein [Ferranicluibacter rubi]PYE33922.1 tagaturonate reductase [Rhizobium sp. PP-WC-1G-195]PYE94445.1 tagaturonate reductase [Rhizobium sp. PP-F2F-G38]TCP80392.1 tagaturonate reductase [Rhizobium sp. PP-CC-2G-626]TCQ23754.1 tagaturonate reductase [Rhizobium sp. PP-CC-3G-465]NHT75529.1 mannitol dehydrogenase family protein [Ferranicluibacter rubi]
MSTRIIQFGTSRFLQAHVDLFVHEAREAGQAIGPITIVQVSGSAERAGRVAAFGHPQGYPIIIRGIEAGRQVERRISVTSVDGGISALADWAKLKALFANDAAFIVSNTGDRGYELSADDRSDTLFSGRIPTSFVGKLAVLLFHRWQAQGGPLTVLPCELLNRNGDILQQAVLSLAAEAGADEAFLHYVETEVIFANTLVDRIVSEPIEPVGAVAEPYALWAIEAKPGLALPFDHPSVVLTDDLEPYERLKLHILNLGHTVLADIWLREGRAQDETVRALLQDAAIREQLLAVYRQEVVPGFAAHGMADAAKAYVEVTLERFDNPFLDHRVADIAQNHGVKIERRIGAFLDWVAETGTTPAAPVLRGLIAGQAVATHETERAKA